MYPAAIGDVSTGWELSRLFPRVLGVMARGGLAPDGAEAAQLRVVAQRMIEAGWQRRDCQETAAQLRHALAQSALPSAMGTPADAHPHKPARLARQA